MASPTSSSQALTKRSSDTALMPPPPPPKRIKRPPKVLDEDTYTNALDHIIARDFFPGLLETEAQQDYINALDSRNNEWIAEAGRRLTEVMTPGPDGRRKFGRRGVSLSTPGGATPLVGRAGETPRGWGGETPMSSRGGAGEEAEDSEEKAREEEEREEREKMRTMGLNAFQAKYTSEDNESFNALLDRQNNKRAEKYAWLWNGNKIATGRQIAYRDREQKLLKAAEEGSQRVRNNDRALVRRDPEKEADKDTRKAMVDHKPAAPRNGLMFTPDSVEDTHETIVQAAEARSTAPPKAIVYNNTRLPSAAADTNAAENSIPPSPSLSAINDAIRGRPRPTASEAAYSGAETPRVNGYAFVDAEDPEPEEENSEVDRSLLQRLGITAAGSSPNPFKIHQASRREELHHRLVDKTAKSKRQESGTSSSGSSRLAALKGEASSTPAAAGKATPGVPRFVSSPVVSGGKVLGSSRGGNLTPAARRLFEKVGTPKREGFGAFGGSGSGKGSATPNRAVRWTPTPRLKRKEGI